MIAAASLVAVTLALADSDVHEIRLKNGMVWLVVERPQAPVFTGFVRVKVGGLDEEQGSTGLAHLFEHMAFKGTPVLGTKDFEAEKKLLDQIAVTGDQLATLSARARPRATTRARCAKSSKASLMKKRRSPTRTRWPRCTN